MCDDGIIPNFLFCKALTFTTQKNASGVFITLPRILRRKGLQAYKSFRAPQALHNVVLKNYIHTNPNLSLSGPPDRKLIPYHSVR